jgi:hypothetical protein
MRYGLKTLNLGNGVRTLVRFKIGHYHVSTLLCQIPGIQEHLKGLTNTCGIAKINFEIPARGSFWRTHRWD